MEKVTDKATANKYFSVSSAECISNYSGGKEGYQE